LAVRLEWDGKPTRVERLTLPFQTVETINESRATRERDRGALFGGAANGRIYGWRNQLIWGDNKLIMSSLLAEHAGTVDLVYIDPPFATGDDFTVEMRVGDTAVVKQPSILEEHAYRDTWGRGKDSYLTMMYERLVLLNELLSAKGSIYVHCDTRANSSLRLLLDEIFGERVFRNEIRWTRSLPKNDPGQWGRSSDSILYYTKSDGRTFNAQYVPQKAESVTAHYRKGDDGRMYRLASLLAPGGRGPLYDFHGYQRNWRFTVEKMRALEAEGRIMVREGQIPSRIYYLDESQGSQVQDVWTDLSPLNPMARERTGYPTQKPESLLERIISSSSHPGDLVLDCFAEAVRPQSSPSVLIDDGSSVIWDGSRFTLRGSDCWELRTAGPSTSRTSVPTSGSAGRSRPATALCGPTSTRSSPSIGQNPSTASRTFMAAKPAEWCTSERQTRQ